MLTTSEVCALCGLPATTLTEWVAKGYVTPDEKGGKGRGNSHRFGLMQAVGAVVAARLYQSDRGCVVGFVTEVVDAFDSVSEKWLQKQFAEGQTHFVMVHQGRPLLRARQYDWVDVKEAYNQVAQKIAGRVEDQPARGAGAAN